MIKPVVRLTAALVLGLGALLPAAGAHHAAAAIYNVSCQVLDFGGVQVNNPKTLSMEIDNGSTAQIFAVRAVQALPASGQPGFAPGGR